MTNRHRHRDQDDVQLAAMGYEPELERNFSTLSMLGLAFSVMNSWTALSASLSVGLTSGGSTSVIWGSSMVGQGGRREPLPLVDPTGQLTPVVAQASSRQESATCASPPLSPNSCPPIQPPEANTIGWLSVRFQPSVSMLDPPRLNAPS
ncbi:hypothetical protein RJ55_01986 [Drechmeria coniospora]|nr:hypothetical protein RJ55_01986 [Drechmeria coniospora]